MTFDKIETAAEEEAAARFARERSSPISEDSRREKEAWLAADEANRAAYGALSRLWSGLEAVRAHPSVLSIRDEARRTVERRRTSRLAAGMAAAVLLVGAIGLVLNSGGLGVFRPDVRAPVVFETAMGQLSTVALPDGSVAVLDTGTTIEVLDGVERRAIRLLRGRALFKVRHDATRPFVVTAMGRSITAVGTEFEVYIKPSAVDVGLIEGRVKVQRSPRGARSKSPSTVDLTAGHRLISSNDDWAIEEMPANVAPAWLSRQLVFREASLAEIVAEVNRYSPQKIVLADRQVGLKRMSAVLRSDEPSTFLASVETLGLGRVSRAGDGYTISER